MVLGCGHVVDFRFFSQYVHDDLLHRAGSEAQASKLLQAGRLRATCPECRNELVSGRTLLGLPLVVESLCIRVECPLDYEDCYLRGFLVHGIHIDGGKRGR